MDQPRARVPMLSQIMAVAAQFCGVKLADMMRQDRSAALIRARMLAYALARDHGYSMPETGRAVRRDHSSVLGGLRRFDALAPCDPALRRLHEGARSYLALVTAGCPQGRLRADVAERIATASPDELACVARFLGVGDG